MPLYLDNNATTALDSQVLDAMLPYMQGFAGNPSSVHRFGRLARNALEQARIQVAALVGAQPGQVIFTSGGTEANNLALQGMLGHLPAAHLAVSAIEHASLLAPAEQLQHAGWQLDTLPVNRQGQLEAETLAAKLSAESRLVSVMMANNETGVLQNIAALRQQTAEYGAWFHSDASQAAGKIAINFMDLQIDLMTLSSHKLYGPQGTGALIVNRALDIKPIIRGGGQERGLRSGTENIAAIVGFGMAAELAKQQLSSRAEHCLQLREALFKQLQQLSGIKIFSEDVESLPNTVQFAIAGFDGETLLMQLDRKGIAVSSGSACHAEQTEPSHVLVAMGIDKATARGAIRVSFGKDNRAEDVTTFMDALQQIMIENES